MYGYNSWEVAFRKGGQSTTQYYGIIIQKARLDNKDMIIDNSQKYYDAYKKHHVFDEIDHMMEFYDCISYSSSSFFPNGTLNIGNYEANIYQSIRTTLDSIKNLLKVRHISDAFVLIRKLFDTVLANIYLDVVREDEFDWMNSSVVKDLDE